MGIGIYLGIVNGMDSVRGGSGKTLYVFDDFNRADSATDLGTATSGQLWTNQVGNIGISSNKAYMPNVGTSIATINSSASLVAVSFVDSGIQETSLFNGIVTRYTDTSNYIRVVLQTTTLFIQRRQTGTTTTIGSIGVTRNDGDAYTVISDAAGITAFKNGVNILSVPETFNNTATRQGIIMSSTLARMDNFKVESL